MKLFSTIKRVAAVICSIAGLATHSEANCLLLPPPPNNEATVFVSVTWGVPLGTGKAPQFSYFKSTIGSIPTPPIPAGDYATWCFDVATTIDPGGPDYYPTLGTTYDGFLISSCDPQLNNILPNHPNVKVGPTTWNKINWLINNRSQSCNGLTPTMWEVQNAIYVLFGQPQVPPDPELTARQPVIDCLVAAANAHADFTPECGQKIAVVLDIAANLDDLIPDVQLLFLEVPYCPNVVLTPANGCFNSIADAVAAAQNANKDICGLTVTPSANTTAPCLTDITIKSSYLCGQTPKVVSTTYTVTIDGAAPVISVPEGGNLGCNPLTLPTDESIKALVGVTEACSTPRINVTHADDNSGCNFSRTFTITATDACGHVSDEKNVVFTWRIDTVAPTIEPLSNQNLGCNPTALPEDADIKALVSASDNCTDSELVINVTHQDASTGCNVKRTFAIEVTDGCAGNKATASVEYIWRVDTTAPTIQPLSNKDLGCNPATLPDDADIKALISASDNCTDSQLVINVTHQDSTTGCSVKRTFAIEVTDGCAGNKATASVEYTWRVDTTAPTIQPLSNKDLGCNPATLPEDADIKALVSASDNCTDSQLVINVTHQDSTTGCNVKRTFAIEVTDGCAGNKATASVDYTWRLDTIAPTITPLQNQDLGCNPNTIPDDATIKALVTATDDCSDATVTITVSHTDVTTGCDVKRTFSIEATDGCAGNKATSSVVYTWKADTTPPTITCPPDYTSPTPQVLAFCSYTQGGWGACPRGSNPASILAKNFSTVYPGGFVEVGIPGAGGFSMKFQSQLAIQNYLPAGGTAGALNADKVNPMSTSAGVFGGQVLALQLNVDFSKAGIIGGVSGPYGDLVFTDATSPFNGKTVADILKAANILLGGGSIPGVTISALNDLVDNLNRAFDNCSATSWAKTHFSTTTSNNSGPGVATATDNCDPNPAITYKDEVVSTGCSAIVRTWTATDACGNSVSCTQKLSLTDTVPPVLTVPANLSVQCLSQVPGVGTASATDNSDANPKVTYLGETASGTDCNKTITRTWKATDACGNSVTKCQVITVKDTIPPVISGIGANKSYECPAPVTLAWSTPTATDNCGGTVTLTYVDSRTALCANSYCVKRTWTAKDACGNISTACQTITVTDTTPPTITCPGNVQVACGGDTSPASTGFATAVDSCSGPVTPTYNDSVCTDQSGNTIITRVWTAQDSCGNCSKCTQIITVAKCVTGTYATYTPGGWGAPPNGNNIAQRLADKFTTVYPNGCVYVGLTSGGYYLKFTSAAAIQAFLPYGGTPNKLSNSFKNPTGSDAIGAGEFASQVLALELNVDFSNKGIIKPGLSGLKVAAGNKLAGKTVTQVLALANTALGGGGLPNGCTYSDLTDLLSKINGNYDNGTSNNGYLVP